MVNKERTTFEFFFLNGTFKERKKKKKEWLQPIEEAFNLILLEKV